MTELILNLLLSLALWWLVWMERAVQYKQEWSKSSVSFWEIRTFALISFLWAIWAYISSIFQNWLFVIITLLIISFFLLIYYYYSAVKEKQIWLTTELASIATFFLWVFVMIWQAKTAIILCIILTFLLWAKPFFDWLMNKVNKEELNNTIKFAVISIVILPLLPDQKYSISGILNFLWFEWDINNSIMNLEFFNPYWIWFFVVLMAWISYAGYVMSKVIGEKWSIIASWAIWWLISSTAVTASMTQASKKDTKNMDLYVVSTLIASTIMFIRVIIIVLFFNINMISSIIYPSISMLIWMLIYMVYFYIKSKKEKSRLKIDTFEEKKYTSPFSIWPALKFAWFVIIIKFIAWVGWLYQDFWWDYFFYALGAISWLADVDAISQTMSVDALDGQVWINIAAITIIIAIISNNLVKWTMALKMWEKKFWVAVMLWFIVATIMWGVWMIVMSLFN